MACGFLLSFGFWVGWFGGELMGEVPGGVTPPEVTAEAGNHTAALADEKPVEVKSV